MDLAATIISVVVRLQELQCDSCERFQTARSALLLRIFDLAFERPVMSITGFAEALGVTYGGAENNLRELVRRA